MTPTPDPVVADLDAQLDDALNVALDFEGRILHKPLSALSVAALRDGGHVAAFNVTFAGHAVHVLADTDPPDSGLWRVWTVSDHPTARPAFVNMARVTISVWTVSDHPTARPAFVNMARVTIIHRRFDP